MCEISLITGVPQSLLMARYSSQEITELMALKSLQYKENDKHDIRISYILKHLESMFGHKTKLDYRIKYYDPELEAERERLANMTPYERGMYEKQKIMRL